MIRLPPISTLFPSTTLFRSRSPCVTRRCPCRDYPRGVDPETTTPRARRRRTCRCRPRRPRRSEEHTSELQSQFHLVCRLLLEKKKRHSNVRKVPCAVQRIQL